MNRIYLRHIELLIKSDNRSRVFLSYMKVRNASKSHCGGFNLSQLIKAIQTSDTTARKTLKLLINYGYVSETKTGLYKVNSFKSLIGNNTHEKFYKITDQELFSYNWKNISHFRAMLVELLVQKNRNTRKTLRKGFFVITRDGVREKISRPSKRESDKLVATTYVAKCTQKNRSTISKYRRKQKLVKYLFEFPIVVKKDGVANDDYLGLNGIFLDKKAGKFFEFKNKLIFVPISTRFGKVLLNGY